MQYPDVHHIIMKNITMGLRPELTSKRSHTFKFLHFLTLQVEAITEFNQGLLRCLPCGIPVKKSNAVQIIMMVPMCESNMFPFSVQTNMSQIGLLMSNGNY